MNARARDRRLLVLYDADCGICTRSARVLRRIDRRNRLHLMPLQSAPDLAGSPSLDVLLEAIHVRDEEGGWTVASAAWIRIWQEVDIFRPLAHLAGLPMIRRFVAWTYGLVAGNRYRLSRLLGDDACQTEPRRDDRHNRPAR
jgi:predicted DCC family thiol-disulfide oxidoreductase YuxK